MPWILYGYHSMGRLRRKGAKAHAQTLVSLHSLQSDILINDMERWIDNEHFLSFYPGTNEIDRYFLSVVRVRLGSWVEINFRQEKTMAKYSLLDTLIAGPIPNRWSKRNGQSLIQIFYFLNLRNSEVNGYTGLSRSKKRQTTFLLLDISLGTRVPRNQFWINDRRVIEQSLIKISRLSLRYFGSSFNAKTIDRFLYIEILDSHVSQENQRSGKNRNSRDRLYV